MDSRVKLKKVVQPDCDTHINGAINEGEKDLGLESR